MKAIDKELLPPVKQNQKTRAITEGDIKTPLLLTHVERHSHLKVAHAYQVSFNPSESMKQFATQTFRH